VESCLYFVAGGVTTGVIDDFEAVEIKKQQGAFDKLFLSAGDGSGQPSLETRRFSSPVSSS
jgi:hypothetical protein